MQPQRAREILLSLVNGVDPLTHEDLPNGTILEKAETVRALLIGVATIEQAMDRASRRAQLPRNIGRTWTAEENSQLHDAFQAGVTLTDIAARHGRTKRAIEARLEKLGLITAEQRSTIDRFGSIAREAANGTDPRLSHESVSQMEK
jgi:hypothetical protein